MPFKINVKSAFVYLIFAVACLFLNGAASGVPLSLGLYFSLLICGGNIIAAPVAYIACSAVHLSLTAFLCALAEAAFLLFITLLYRHTGRKIRFEAAIFFIIALAPFIAFSDWDSPILELLGNAYLSRAVAAAVIALAFLFSYKSVYACIFRLGRCRLKEDELFSLAVIYVLAGTGIINLAGELAYCALTAFIISLSVRFFKGPAALLPSLAAGLPPAISSLSLMPLTVCLCVCALSLLFVRAGRCAPPVCVCAFLCGQGYFAGWYEQGTTLIILRVAAIAVGCALAAIPSDIKLKALFDTLTVKKELSDTAINRERERTGEKLFRMSEVFREVECAFKDMDEATDEAGAKKRVVSELKEKLCANCEKRARCEKSVVYKGFASLVEAGTLKGKVNLIDLPPAITQNCIVPTEVISALNSLLIEYRRFMAEAENARTGRKLLADQAKGISAVLKNNAVELCQKKRSEETGRGVVRALAAAGIACPEAYFSAETEEVYAVLVGEVNLSTVCAALTRVTGKKYMLKDKTELGGEKRCCIFCRPPKFDAVFGVAGVKKRGENASGDTHSVIRINEHRFLMALSDGMGSGEYARKVSRTAISLIEAFYRAEMPEGTVLDTINKLLAFSREERFACIDICSVDLNSGAAEFVKIGSPVALILREDGIKVLEGESLPLGILEVLRPTVSTDTLGDGDMLVFMSDGITTAFSSTPELLEFLQSVSRLNPQNVADKLLAGALERTGGRAEDDMTVLCTRIFAAQDARDSEQELAAMA